MKVIGDLGAITTLLGIIRALVTAYYTVLSHLRVISIVDCYAIAQQCSREIGDQTLTLGPKLAYENYCADLCSWQRNGCSYESHLTNIIDKIIDGDSQCVIDNVTLDTMDISVVVDSMDNGLDGNMGILHGMALSNGHTKDGSEHKKIK